MGTPSGSTNYISDVILKHSSRRQVHVLLSPFETLAVTLTTTVSFAYFPQYIGDPNGLYKKLSELLSRAIFSGNFTKVLRRMSKRDNNNVLIFSSSSNVTLSLPAFSGSNPTTPVQINSNTKHSGLLTDSELSVTVAIVIIGVLLLAMTAYAIIRHFMRASAKYKQAQEITAVSLDDLPYNYPAFSQEYFTQNDLDLDKLNYIADVSETKV